MFEEQVQRTSKIFKAVAKQKKVKLFSHLDADGLCSAAIMTKMMLREGINFELKIAKQLTRDVIEKIEAGENDILLFTDLGSGQLKELQKFFDKTQVFVLDHHEPQKIAHINLFHMNPLAFAEEGISSSMISYLFARNINAANGNLVDLATVGAVGDEQDEKWEFKGFARKIVEEGEILGKIKISKGMRLYGRNTRPIHKALANSFDPFIPGISGDESAAVQFLSELGIDVKNNDEWKKLKDLTTEEQQKLASAIIIERMKLTDAAAEDIFGDNYTLVGRSLELGDAREFATLLNACGRLGRYDVALRICLNDATAVLLANEILEQYRMILSQSLEIFRANPQIADKTKFANYLLFGSMIPDTIVGTITSIALNSEMIDKTKPVLAFVDTENDMVKISARVGKGSSEVKNINLRDVVVFAAAAVDGEGGGHKLAAGALIAKGKEKEFIKAADNVIEEQLR
ncbi:MAG TPA: DHH family phosphoesterase [archaeon]|nr:DHH family phosphoesterase [archaeon]